MDVNCPAVGNGRLCMEGVGAVHAIFLYLSPVATPCSELCNQNYLSVKSQGGMTLSSQLSYMSHLFTASLESASPSMSWTTLIISW